MKRNAGMWVSERGMPPAPDKLFFGSSLYRHLLKTGNLVFHNEKSDSAPRIPDPKQPLFQSEERIGIG
jgi:hypothetical protein